MKLEDYRDEIDKIDLAIDSLLNKRFEIAKEISNYKKKNDINVTDTKREDEIFEKILSRKYGLYKQKIYKEIIKMSKSLQKQKNNIVLIGMPGVGKTTIAKEISRISSYKFIDLDLEIVKRYGNIEDIFADYGEEYFRELESKTLREVTNDLNYVLASGGGTVIRECNHYFLKKNSSIFFLKRDLSLLPTANRPVSKKNSLRSIYERRFPIYKKLSNFEIENEKIETTAKKIIEIFEKENERIY
ncbi:MAG: shikimate kinase [Tissierellia bacterium]|nr:shikimate kinase [Tissierellia bacterium]